MKVMVNKCLLEGNYDLILSIGQVVPHEVVGMANYTKNVCVGLGGSDLINKSHFLGAACNMEKIMGRADTPVRKAFNYAVDEFMADMPIYYMLTVIGKEQDGLVMRGFYCADDEECFLKASKLSQQVNLDLLDKPIKKCVVYLTPKEFGSTWLGNKAVYRTRMVIADDGELIVLAPAVHEFGEDPDIDKLIRKYGYKGTPATMKAVEENEDIRNNLGAAAHLIHGSSEGRFKITYCTDEENMTQKEVEDAGFNWASYKEMAAKYDPEKMKDGYQTIDGEEVYYISNPALGLWALESNF
jgi:nickel-dependent lactate racemase